MGEKKKKRIIKILAERLTPGLTETERKFLLAAELGDESLIKHILENEIVSSDVSDTQGRTVLDLSIIFGHENLVNYLFGRMSSKKIHQGLLCAVESDRAEICEILLRHPLYRRRTIESEVHLYIDEDTEDVPKVETTLESSNLNNIAENGEQNGSRGRRRKSSVHIYAKVDKMLKEALMRAAIKNNFQIVQMIMLRGVSLQIPHDYFCTCDQCINDRLGDYMVFCTNRLDTFRALASPAYIVLTEEDPIVASFHLSKRFQKLKVIETENQKTYDELDQQCQHFTLNLVDQCRTSDEVKTLLSGRNTTSSFSEVEEDGVGEKSNDNFPLLSLAMRMDQKKFVSHSKCQAQVSEMWFRGLQLLRHLNRFEFLLLSIPVGMVILPILSIIYVVAPWSKVTMLLNTPLTRFLSYMCSYLTFLTVIVLCKLQFSGLFLTIGCDETPLYVYALIILVFVWVIGWIWEEMKQLYNEGATDYFLSLWNIVDSLMLTFLLSSFTLDVVIPLRMRKILQHGALSMNESGTIIRNLTMMPLCYDFAGGFLSTSIQNMCFASKTLVIKAKWHPEWVPDPELLSDVMFSAGIILSVSRISFIMPVNETFGSMLVSFRRTFTDLVKLFAMFLLILLSFTCGIAALYAAHVCQTEFFQGFGGTFFLLVWSLLGFGPGEAPKLNDQNPMSSLTNNISRYPIVEWLGYVLYGVYVFAALIVLMNLLIAVMSNTFQEVQDERDIEWKYSRTELWLTFIEPGTCVAPPFNVIPTPKDIYYWFQLLSRFLRRCFRIMKREPLYTNEGDRMKKEVEEAEIQSKKHAIRQDVMCTLVRRYILHAERVKVEEGEDAAEDKLRRLIERVANKLEERVEDLNGQISKVDDHVNSVQRGGMDIQTMQQSEIDLTQTLINTHEEYLKMIKTIWEDSKDFREKKVNIIHEIRDDRKALLASGDSVGAQKLEDDIIDILEDADFIPRTTIYR